MHSAARPTDTFAALPRDRVSVDPRVRGVFSSDLYSLGSQCDAVVMPRAPSEVQVAVRAAAEAGLRIVPRGAGLTYTGGCVPPGSHCVVLDLSRLDRIVDISADDMFVSAEAGCTWRQLHLALGKRGLRLPCFGTHSGALATVGGGLSAGAVFFGTARYGTVADSLLGLEVVLADGSLVRTGQAALSNARKPAYRLHGPDVTGLFVHDSGIMGVKTQATFRVMRSPHATAFGSFVFPSLLDAAAALCEVSRAELAEEAYVLDPASTRRGLAGVSFGQGLRTLAKTVSGAGRLRYRLKAAMGLMAAGRTFAVQDAYSLHVVCAGRSERAVECDLEAVRATATQYGGTAVPDVIPRGTRANLFPAVNAVLGPKGERWAALNAKVAHSDAATLIKRAESLLAENASELETARVSVSRMLTAMSNNVLSYEPVLHWSDEWLPMHRLAPDPAHVQSLHEPPVDLSARATVHRVRRDLLLLFEQLGATANQLGRTYAYMDSLRPETSAMLRRLKSAVDPDGLMNPGALGTDDAKTGRASEINA